MCVPSYRLELGGLLREFDRRLRVSAEQHCAMCMSDQPFVLVLRCNLRLRYCLASRWRHAACQHIDLRVLLRVPRLVPLPARLVARARAKATAHGVLLLEAQVAPQELILARRRRRRAAAPTVVLALAQRQRFCRRAEVEVNPLVIVGRHKRQGTVIEADRVGRALARRRSEEHTSELQALA